MRGELAGSHSRGKKDGGVPGAEEGKRTVLGHERKIDWSLFNMETGRGCRTWLSLSAGPRGKKNWGKPVAGKKSIRMRFP